MSNEWVPSPVSVSSIAPTLGHTGGKTVVEIVGSGFRVPADPPPNGIAPPPAKTVRVLFGDVEASLVEVAGPDLLFCKTPIHDPGPVDVVVQNLGETPAELVSELANSFPLVTGAALNVVVNGEAQSVTVGVGDIGIENQATPAEAAAILNRLRGIRATVRDDGTIRLRTDVRGPGATLAVSGAALTAFEFPSSAVGSATLEPIDDERATLAQAFTFARPKLDVKTPLTLALEQLQVELRRQVIENVSMATHSDFDPETGDLLNVSLLGELPSIILGGLELPDSKDRRVLGPREVAGSASDRAATKAPHDIVDAVMTLVAVTDDPVEAVNLYTVLRRVFRKNSKLSVPGNPFDPGLPTVEYDLDWRMEVAPGVTVQADAPNLIVQTGTIAIRGIPIGDIELEYSGPLPAGAPSGPHEATTAVTWRNESTIVGTERKA